MNGTKTTIYTIDGREVVPTLQERLGLLLITAGGWLLKGSKPSRIEYRHEEGRKT